MRPSFYAGNPANWSGWFASQKTSRQESFNAGTEFIRRESQQEQFFV